MYLHSSPNIIRLIKSRRLMWVGACDTYWERRGAYRVLVGKLEGMWPTWRPRRRWEDNVKFDVKKWDEAWTRFFWLRLGAGGELLWMRWWNSGFRKIRGMSWLAVNLIALEEVLWSMELFRCYEGGQGILREIQWIYVCFRSPLERPGRKWKDGIKVDLKVARMRTEVESSGLCPIMEELPLKLSVSAVMLLALNENLTTHPIFVTKQSKWLP